MSNTIIALSTANTTCAIAVIRLSGDNAFEIVKKAFSGFGEKTQPRYMYYGTLDAGKVKDDCMCVYFKAPHSYTGEDVVEINCHGSTAIVKGILEYFLKNGAIMAQRGEFTQRAFMNGKLDLTECEGVIDLINAKTEAEARSAYGQLSGLLGRKIEKIQRQIITTIAKIEVALDYPEEDVEDVTENESKQEILSIKDQLVALENGYDGGRIMREGVKVAIIGKPNVGKSKILNSLLGYERAIVTDIEGTTRDTLQESYEYGGMRFTLTDTAGIRETQDVVEQMGVARSKEQAKNCDIVLLVTEAGSQYEKIDTDAKIILVENKTDICSASHPDSVKVSAKTGDGIEELKQTILTVATSNVTLDDGCINNLRHLSCVREAISYVDQTLDAIGNTTLDMVSSELNNAYRALGKITGVISSDEIVGEIFTKFCVGK